MKEAFLAYLILGSNLGNRRHSIRHALQLLKKEIELMQISSVYETKAYGYDSKYNYYNLAITVQTELSPTSLLEKILNIEKQVGRIRGAKKWTDRNIDIDIALYENQIIQTHDCRIPHYDLVNRDFFLIPLLELNPNLLEPISNEKLSSILDSLDENKKTYPTLVCCPL